MSNTTRIAKNTLMLYFRQILIMLVSLYTVRVVLETLGAEDYGIYNVVAGVVTMFGFLSSSMAASTQRYLSIELGRNNVDQLKKVFGISLSIYAFIALVVLLLAETAGLWFVNNKLVIPPERKTAALWVYQTSIVSFLFTIFATPYLAAVIAHEDMSIYAFVSLFESVSKLSIVFVLRLVLTDKLKLYGMLMCGAVAIHTGMYIAICRIKYDECKDTLWFERKRFNEILSFSLWKLTGSISTVLKYNGINILLNQFFSPLAVVARGIAVSVNIAVESFAGNFLNAVRPKIIKLYAGSEISRMFVLVFSSAKGTFFLVYIFVVPVIIELPLLFSFWLKTTPEYAAIFTRLMLVDILLRSVFYPFGSVLEATGKIKAYQLAVYGIALINLPGSWLLLSYGKLQPYYIVFISILCTICINITELFFCKKLILFPVRTFVKEVLIPVAIVILSAPVFPIVIRIILGESFGRLCLITTVNLAISSLLMYALALKKNDRKNIHIHIRRMLHWAYQKSE